MSVDLENVSAAEIAQAVRAGEYWRWRLREEIDQEDDVQPEVVLSGGLDPLGSAPDTFDVADIARRARLGEL